MEKRAAAGKQRFQRYDASKHTNEATDGTAGKQRFQRYRPGPACKDDLGSFLSSIIDGYYEVDLEGNILRINDSLGRMLGYSAEAILGESYRTFCTTQVQDQIRQASQRVARGEPVHRLEGEMTRRNGSPLSFELSISPIYDQKGCLSGYRGIIRDVSDRKQAEDLMRTLSRKLIDTLEMERRRIARELHDEVGQALTALKINLQMLEQTGPELRKQLQDCVAIVDQTLQEIRQLSLDLRPSLLDDLGLVAAVRWHVDYYSRLSGFSAEFTTNLSEIRLPPAIETTCYRIVQESFTNIIRHAKATHVQVSLVEEDGKVHLFIRDNGQGFDVGKARANAAWGKSLGLLGMKERVALIGGDLHIHSVRSCGTEVHAVINCRGFVEREAATNETG